MKNAILLCFVLIILTSCTMPKNNKDSFGEGEEVVTPYQAKRMIERDKNHEKER